MTDRTKSQEVNEAAVIREPGSSMENKTGSWRTFRPVPVEGKCTGCGICGWYCPEQAITIETGKDGKKQQKHTIKRNLMKVVNTVQGLLSVKVAFAALIEIVMPDVFIVILYHLR